MSYAVKEIFLTLQGEGAHAGRAAVFCRFSGCNLWSGREQDRATATCRFCDTDFVGTDGTLGGRYASAQALADDLSRFLNNEPIAVRKAGWRERTWKWLMRNPMTFANLAVTGLLLAIVLWNGYRATAQLRSERDAAKAELDRVLQMYQELVDAFPEHADFARERQGRARPR